MAGFDGNGNYLRSYSWVTDKANGVPITASRFDTEDNGFAAGLTLCVTRDGQGKPTVNFLPASDFTLNLGSLTFRWKSINGILTFTSGNGITQSVPASGVAYAASGAANAYVVQWTGNPTSGQSLGQLILAGTTSADFASRIQNQAGTQDYQVIQGDGQQYIFAPTAATAGPANTFQTGYLDAPQNLQNATYTFALTDRGKQVAHNSASAHTWTIPANASVAFPLGTIIQLVGFTGVGLVTLAITSDVLIWTPSGTTGSRTLTPPFVASIEKVDATHWLLAGNGIT